MEDTVLENKRVCYCCGSDKTYTETKRGYTYPKWFLNKDETNSVLCGRCFKGLIERPKYRNHERIYRRQRYWKNPEKMRDIARKSSAIYRLRHPIRAKETMRSYRQRCKEKALEIVGRGKIECRNCHIKDIRVLSINHVNGDGRIFRGRRGSGRNETYQRIINGLRPTSDLNLLCWNCNHLHWIEMIQNKSKHLISS